MTRQFILIFIQSLIFIPLFGQSNNAKIYIFNGSFEGTPRCCTPPDGWIDCGFRSETPPDIQPIQPPLEPLYGVTKKAYDGKTYLGMVVRDNESNERINQKLSEQLLAGKCYSFSIYMTRSMEYVSPTMTGAHNLIPFTTPALLQIWGGDVYCHQKELLATSQLVENTEWQRFDFELMPKSNISFLQLEAYYKTSSNLTYNGNILLDKASDIILIHCKTDK